MLRCTFLGLALGCLLLLPSSAAGVGQSVDSTKSEEGFCPDAETQFELNACAAEELKKEDAELNRVYQEILKRYKDDPEFIKKLRESQRAWLTFRDAQFEAMFPHLLNKQGQYYYGSIYPMCAAQYKANLTYTRIQELRLWLDGTEEGDVCAGSLPTKAVNP